MKVKATLESSALFPCVLCFSVVFIFLIALLIFKRFARASSRKTQKKDTQEEADEEPTKRFLTGRKLHVVNTAKPRLSRKARKRLRRTDEKAKVTQLSAINSSREDDQSGRENTLEFIKDIGEKNVFAVNIIEPKQKQKKNKAIKVTNTTTRIDVKKTVPLKPIEEKEKNITRHYSYSRESNYKRSRKPRRCPFTLRDFILPSKPTYT